MSEKETSIAPKSARTLSRDLIISLVLIVVVVSSLLIFSNYVIASRKAKAQLEQKADEYLSYLLHSLELPIWNIDEESAKKIGRSYIDNELIARLRITEAAGNVIFDRAKEDKNDLIERAGEVSHDGRTIGRIEIGLTSRLYKENNNRLLWTSILTMLVVILAIIGATGFLLRIFLRNPLNLLIQGIDRLAGGEYEYKFHEAKQKEIETIISRFNYMAEQIKGREESLTEINRQLEDEIGERKGAEEAMRKSEEKYRSILESIEEGYFEVDIAGNFTFFNDSLCKIFGYPHDELMGMNNREHSTPETARKIYKIFNEIYRTGKPVRMADYESIRKDGRTIPLEISASLMRDPAGKPIGFRGVIRDVTERNRTEEEKKRLETQLQHAERLEAIGTLAGGIAHDFNNLLMGIQGNASLALLNMDTGHPHYEKLKNIEQYVQSGAGLTDQLLGFARGGKYEVKPTDLNDLIEKSSRIFGRTKKEINIHKKYQEDIWTVEVDQGQIEQVLLNLYVNAWQAMPGGGELYLQTENVTLDQNYVKSFEAEDGNYVKVSITDTGVGMDKETVQRIFEPFFTTREMGRGTGLGLASAYGIIRNHGGIISVYSEKGSGSIFNIYLPTSEKEVIKEKKLSEEIFRGTETILFVDDEDMVINVGREMLEEMGYKALIARSGKEAIEAYRENRDGIDIVILDMVMPDMGGGETYDLLREFNPDVKVLLASGYSIDGQATEILERGCDGFIQKPFNLKGLSQKIREVLDKE